MRSIATTPVVLVALALILSACGGSSDEVAEAPPPEPTTEEVLETGPSAEELEESASAEDCLTQFTPLVDSLVEVDGRLDVGLSYSELSDYLGDVGVAYQRVDFAALNPTCIATVGVPAEQAFNSFNRSLRVWGDCIDDYACEIDSIDPQLQRIWRQASRQTTKAQDAVRDQEALANLVG